MKRLLTATFVLLSCSGFSATHGFTPGKDHFVVCANHLAKVLGDSAVFATLDGELGGEPIETIKRTTTQIETQEQWMGEKFSLTHLVSVFEVISVRGRSAFVCVVDLPGSYGPGSTIVKVVRTPEDCSKL